MFRLSLRQKLLLVSSLILIIPWLGIRYVKAIEDYLQQLILDNLAAYTQSVATSLTTKVNNIPTYPTGDAVYASSLRVAPTLDGYDADWGDYSASDIRLKDSKSGQLGPAVKIARHNDTLYFFITAQDSDINYYQLDYAYPDTPEVDGIELQLELQGERKTLSIITEAPGLIYARDIESGQRYSRIQGTWQESENGVGYQVEFKMPVTYAAAGISLIVHDNDIGNSNSYILGETNMPVLSTPESLRELLAQFNMVEGRRLRLLDNEGRMLAATGSLALQQNLKPVNPLFAWLLIPDEIADPWDGQTSIVRSDIQSAIAGQAISQRTRVDNNSSMLLSSAWPVIQDNEVRAVVLIEESTAALQVLQRSALASLLNVSLLIFLLLAAVLIAFAGRLSNRIRQLEALTDKAIDKQGRVQGHIPNLRHGDELDELNNHIRAMLIRLRAYHDYLEKLAARLAHEIRTPVAVVRSSLENIHQQVSDNDPFNISDNLERANNGVDRLQTLLHRMAEATRLEQSIHESTMDTLEIPKFLTQVVESYRDIYPDHLFEAQCGVTEVIASGDLIAQALDKLVANAVSFAPMGSIVKISTVDASNHWQLCVENTGSQLPEGMEKQLFQSMVSIRDTASRNGQPHLGLGLHIVQLIAEFHGGYAEAENQANGVLIRLSLKK